MSVKLLVVSSATELRERMSPRLREIAPAAIGGKDAGSRNLGHVVSRISVLLGGGSIHILDHTVCLLMKPVSSEIGLKRNFLSLFHKPI